MRAPRGCQPVSFFPDDGDTKGYRLLVSQTSSSIVWAATDDGMYRTTDGGASWDRVQYVVEGGSTLVDMTGTHYDIAYKPGTTTTLYATSGAYFYISTNSGASFTRVNRTDAGLPTTGGRIQIGLTVANSSYVYLLYGDGSAYQGLYLSTNSGNTFSLRSSTPNMLGSQAWRNALDQFPDVSKEAQRRCQSRARQVRPGNYGRL